MNLSMQLIKTVKKVRELLLENNHVFTSGVEVFYMDKECAEYVITRHDYGNEHKLFLVLRPNVKPLSFSLYSNTERISIIDEDFTVIEVI